MSIPPISADPPRHAETWAEVRARGHVMRYRRSGTGRTVVAFGSPGYPDPVWPELLDVLGAGFRLIVPELPATEEDVPCWLSGFLEGLGVSNVRILAAGRLCIPVLQLTLVEGDQIAGVVLVADDDQGEALATTLDEVSVPILVIGRGQPANEVVPLVTGFLRGG